jgi:hypothetical protein
MVTEYRHRRDSDQSNYTLEVDRLDDHEIEELLRQVVVDYRQFHLREADTFDEVAEAELEKKARLAWDTLNTAFGGRVECTELFLRDTQTDVDIVQQEVLRWKNELRWPPGFNAHGATIDCATAASCQARVEEYLAGSLWPFIKVIQ